MLPFGIAEETQERAAFHEAAHMVAVWWHGGDVVSAEICFDDALREWKGKTESANFPKGPLWAQMAVVGGLAEARYVANVYDPGNWTLEKAGLAAALILE